MTRYAELAVTTNFSFLRGGSHPGELVATAEDLGLAAIGIADRNSFAGVVRAYDEWKTGKTVKLLVGTRLVTNDGFEVLAYPTDRKAYGRLCRLLTQGNRKAKKGECHLTFAEVLAVSDGQMLIALPPEEVSHLSSRQKPGPIRRLQVVSSESFLRAQEHSFKETDYGSRLSPGRQAPTAPRRASPSRRPAGSCRARRQRTATRRPRVPQ
jgi:DNA polymerase III alpha subunit